MTQDVCEGLRVEGEEQIALQQQLEQQQAQLLAADEQHVAAQAQLTSLRLTALDGSSNKLLEQVCTNAHWVWGQQLMQWLMQTVMVN